MSNKNLKIYFTSDTHGHVLPVDYTTGKPAPGGLAAIAHEIEKDDNTLVLDGGDSLQGTPFIQYYLENGGKAHPVATGFNAMGLDYYTLGNHDFNFGYDKIRDYVAAMNAQLICANVTDLTGQLPIAGTVIHTLGNGLRIGLTGVVTNWVNIWEKKENLTNFTVSDPYEAAKAALEELRGKCDVTVCIYHGGYEEDFETGKRLSDTDENIACKIGRELDFDLLLTGHQHMAVAGADLNGTWTCQTPDKAVKYAVVNATGTGSDFTAASELVTAGSAADSATVELLAEQEAITENWLDQPAGEFEISLVPEEKLDAALNGSKVACLFNQVQLDQTHADFSCTSLGNEPIGFGKIVSIRDIYTAYPFANTSQVKKVTGATLREALEHCASYFKLEDGKPGISDYFLKPKIEHYNYDFYAGLDYAFDIRKPVGQRVVRLNKLDGTPIDFEQEYTLVTSDYRATGTGGYAMIGNSPLIWSGADNVQDLLVEYIRSHKPLQIPQNVKFEVIY